MLLRRTSGSGSGSGSGSCLVSAAARFRVETPCDGETFEGMALEEVDESRSGRDRVARLEEVFGLSSCASFSAVVSFLFSVLKTSNEFSWQRICHLIMCRGSPTYLSWSISCSSFSLSFCWQIRSTWAT